MMPEEEARQEIDRLLQVAGWQVQDYKDLSLRTALGVAIRKSPLESGRVDYLLFVDRVAVGAIEAKPVDMKRPKLSTGGNLEIEANGEFQ